MEAIDVDRFFIDIKHNEKEAIEDDELLCDINQIEFENLLSQLIKIFNYESKIIDLIFPVTVPMMYKVSEELILNQLSDRFGSIILKSKQNRTYLYIVPYLYNLIREN